MAMQHSCIYPQTANRSKSFSCFHLKYFPKVAGETTLRHTVPPVLLAFNATCVSIPLIMIKSTCISLCLCGKHSARWFCMVNECVMCKPSVPQSAASGRGISKVVTKLQLQVHEKCPQSALIPSHISSRKISKSSCIQALATERQPLPVRKKMQ